MCVCVYIYIYICMVGGFNHLEKYQSMGRIIPYIMENKKCSKPPLSHFLVRATSRETLPVLGYLTDSGHECHWNALDTGYIWQ